jgi:hypothetical protein
LNKNKVLVIVNCRNEVKKYDIPNVLKTKWKDAFTEKYFSPTTSITLQPFEYRVFQNR